MGDVFVEFDKLRRNAAGKPVKALCYAPFVQLSFTPDGNASVCCMSRSMPIGNVSDSRLREIWEGARARVYREALQADYFPEGCESCEWQMRQGRLEDHPILAFDDLPPAENFQWPTQLEFAVSNRCNLGCVMCSGDLSSFIRRRDGLAPLPQVFGERFFEDLREFLPHVHSTSFLGGEPFLQEECYRIWDMMIELESKATVFVTTNGTVFNKRVERVLERLPFDIAISIDGVSREVVEGIRVNARYDILMQNVRKFQQYALQRKKDWTERYLVQLNFCLMRHNWQEMGGFFLLAEEFESRVWVAPVWSPSEHSLFSLPPDQLRRVAEHLDRESEQILPKLGPLNRSQWVANLRLVRAELEAHVAQ